MDTKHKAGKSNIVAHALSRNYNPKSYVNSMVGVEGTMLDNIRKETEKDQVTLRLLKQVVDAITRKFLCRGGHPLCQKQAALCRIDRWHSQKIAKGESRFYLGWSSRPRVDVGATIKEFLLAAHGE